MLKTNLMSKKYKFIPSNEVFRKYWQENIDKSTNANSVLQSRCVDYIVYFHFSSHMFIFF